MFFPICLVILSLNVHYIYNNMTECLTQSTLHSESRVTWCSMLTCQNVIIQLNISISHITQHNTCDINSTSLANSPSLLVINHQLVNSGSDFDMTIRTHWRFSKILKASNKSMWSSIFWCVKVYIYRKFIKYTIHWDKTQMLKKFSLHKINVTKNANLFLLRGSNSSQFYF